MRLRLTLQLDRPNQEPTQIATTTDLELIRAFIQGYKEQMLKDATTPYARSIAAARVAHLNVVLEIMEGEE